MRVFLTVPAVFATALALSLFPTPLAAAETEPFPEPTPWTLAAIEERALPAREEAEVRALLAAVESELAGTRSRLREGPTLALEGGPRRTGGVDRADLAAELDLPLAPAGRARPALREALDGAADVLPAAARRSARLRREELYLDAWLAQRSAAIRAEDVVTVERWLKSARARLEAGADPPFEATLVEGDLLRARLDLATAQREAATAWGELSTLASGLPSAPPALANPDDPDDPENSGDPDLTPSADRPDAAAPDLARPTDPIDHRAAELAERSAASVLVRAAEARLALAEARTALAEALALAPWSLRGAFAREGLDSVGRVGFAYKVPLQGEPRAVRQRFEAEREVARRARDLERGQLDARLASALQGLRALPHRLPDLDLERAIAAVELRLAEGKEHPSAALPIRRQLLETRLALLRRRHAELRLAAELRALTARPDSSNAKDGQP